MLKSLPSTTYELLSNDRRYQVHCNGSLLRIEAQEANILEGEVALENNQIDLLIRSFPQVEEHSPSTAVVIEYLFSQLPSFDVLRLRGWDNVPETSPFFLFVSAPSQIEIRRQDFYQLPCAWHVNENLQRSGDQWTETNGRSHPVRPVTSAGYYYRRYVPSIQKTLAFRGIDLDKDLDTFHEWHNQPRVAALWELNWSKEKLKTYLEDGLRDPHQIPIILEIDGESAGYFEIYWAAEDRLGPYYEYEPYDRGFHFLIGNRKFLGTANTDAVVRSIMHFLYLDDPRTERIVAEPKSDNKLVLKYAFRVPGWRLIKEFDFPHKRAALLMAQRADFFAEGAP